MSIIDEIKSIYGKKVITYYGVLQRGNFDMVDSTPTTITTKRMKRIFNEKCRLGVVVRQFTNKYCNNIPYKNIYSYIHNSDGTWFRLSPEENKEMQCMDYGGEPEEFVYYL